MAGSLESIRTPRGTKGRSGDNGARAAKMRQLRPRGKRGSGPLVLLESAPAPRHDRPRQFGHRGCRSMVGRVLPKHETGVRFSVPAPVFSLSELRELMFPVSHHKQGHLS